MWALNNHTAYAADHGWVRDADGAEIWIVAVKATYQLLPDGSTRIAEHQVPVNHGLVLHSDGISPEHETDLGPPKAATDVWLSGHAWSQNGRPVRHLRIEFEVGPVARRIDVYGDRHWIGGLIASAPKPFTRMPLTWARAYGGNVPGGANANPAAPNPGNSAGGSRPPNLEHSQLFGNLLNPSANLGVGPIPGHWPQRVRYAGTYDVRWQATRAPLQAADLDARYWQASTPEQQVPGRLKGGEKIMLLNLTSPGFAKHGIYRTRIPRLSLGFETHFYDGSRATCRSVIHSLILLPDLPALCVVHHMALPCHPKVNLLDRTVITEKNRPLDRA
jgi:hypothetical protein